VSSILVAIVGTDTGEVLVGLRLRKGDLVIQHEMGADDVDQLAAALTQCAAMLRLGVSIEMLGGLIPGDASDDEIEAAIAARADA
jgi:hypothetical protein